MEEIKSEEKVKEPQENTKPKTRRKVGRPAKQSRPVSLNREELAGLRSLERVPPATGPLIPPAFGDGTPAVPLAAPPPSARPAPLTLAYMPPRYREHCPDPHMVDIELMKWFLAVKLGEDLALPALRLVEDLSAQMSGLFERQAAIFNLLQQVGKALAEIQLTLLHAPLAATSLPQPPAARPPRGRQTVPRAPQSTSIAPEEDDAPYKPEALLEAVDEPTPFLPAGEAETPADNVPFTGRPGQAPRLTRRQAREVVDYAVSLVPVFGSPNPLPAQQQLAQQVGEHWLRQWSKPEASRPHAWQAFLRMEIDRACRPHFDPDKQDRAYLGEPG